MKISTFTIQMVLMLNLLLFSACTSEVVPPPSPIAQGVETVPMATHTATVQVAIETLTPTASSTENSTPDMTPTVIPTLPPKQVARVIQELFEDNSNCLLPCFWGITPGETAWQTAEQFLAPLALRMFLHDTYAEVNLPAPESTQLIELRQFYVFQDDVITQIESPIIQALNFQPAAIMQTYGPPHQVWLNTANASREGHWGFIMNLFYPHQGFMLKYSVEGVQQNDKVRGCGFEQDDLVLLGTWFSDEDLSYETAVERGVGFGEATFALPLEEATGMSVETFYETFKDVNNPICLETPLSLWPAP